MPGKTQLDLRFLVIVISLIVIATMGSAYMTFVFFSRGESSGRADAVNGQVREPFGHTYDAGTLTVNLAPGRGLSNRFIRTGIVIASQDPDTVKELEIRAPQVRDCLISVLRGRTAEEVLSQRGMTQLKQEVISVLNEILGARAISDVYFTDFVVQ
ncbi:MAG: hypothetical protein GX030_02225 [Firmicutes bacterium]|nr:hypothetical protein [Bacillota bacterium]